MSQEQAFLLAAALAVVVSGSVVFYLQRPLQHLLRAQCGSEQGARFWTAFSNVVLMLLPVLGVMLGRWLPPADSSPIFVVVGYLQWALGGLALAMFLVALGASVFRPVEPVVTGQQIDDLQRLVSRIEEMRAQEIVRRAREAREADTPAPVVEPVPPTAFTNRPQPESATN